VVLGGANASVFFLSNVPGITVGKVYSVRVRPVHSSGVIGNWGTAYCLRVGSSGMVTQSEDQNESDSRIESRVSIVSIYPNPTITGSFVMHYNGSRRDESIFAQELVMMDITGKVVFKTNVVMNSNPVEIKFGDLSTGVYVVMVGDQRLDWWLNRVISTCFGNLLSFVGAYCNTPLHWDCEYTRWIRGCEETSEHLVNSHRRKC
jgi:hypothetical protein